MKTSKGRIVILLTFVVACICSTTIAASSAPIQEPPQVERDVYFGLGSIGGNYYPVGQSIGTLVAKYSGGITMVPEVTGGGVENPRLLNSKEIDFGIANEMSVYQAIEGLEPYGEKLDILSVARLHPSAVHIVVLDSSPIKTVEDLRGRTVTLGSAGSGSIPLARDILEEYGMSFDDIVPNYLPTADGFSQLSDGNIDAAITLFGIPGSACLELSLSKKIRIISIDEKILDGLTKKYPYYSKVIIPADAYNTDAEAATVGIANSLAVRSDMEDSVVYWITKSVFDHVSELWTLNDATKTVTQESAGSIALPMHPGAKLYWDSVK